MYKTLTYWSEAGGEPAGWSGLEPLGQEERQGAGLVQPGDGHGAFTAGFSYLMGGCQEDRARLSSEVRSSKARDKRHLL